MSSAQPSRSSLESVIIETAAKTAAETAAKTIEKAAQAAQATLASIPFGITSQAAPVSPLMQKAFEEIRTAVRGDSSFDKLGRIVLENKGKNSARAQVARAMQHLALEAIKQTDGSKDYALADKAVAGLEWAHVLAHLHGRAQRKSRQATVEMPPPMLSLEGVLPH